jgi:hypothetical protein
MATIFKVEEQANQEDNVSRQKPEDCFILSLFFDPEDGGSNFFILNVGLSSEYTTLQFKRLLFMISLWCPD